MRRGMSGLARQVQETLLRDAHGGDLFVFRGRSGSLTKIRRPFILTAANAAFAAK